MSYTTKEEFDVLHRLRVSGLATAEPLVQGTGHSRQTIQSILDDAVARGLAKSRTGGRVEGYMLTSQGRERHTELRARQVSVNEVEALTIAYEAFLAPNREFKQLTTEWQTEAAGDTGRILPRLVQLHEQLGKVLSFAVSATPRMKHYQPQFDSAIAAFRGGDTGALARPMSGSYHDVWMELHEDLLVTLGRERTDADE
ncbi:MarR family transcriptional regulator [Rhodococcus opacus]|uniref:MarR family transcriptional regulator n=1 Tax=Rhodococcus opacus TaxID=37919 RepID=UPI001C47F4AA|nr:helix-turn-helix domain-containing protein [Rhodococcus opacus]MBV6755106.1 MarR family transcriptional regulator [Rhodococcus opacus]